MASHRGATVLEHGRLIDEWYRKVDTGNERPNELQLGALKGIGKRVLTEIELEKEGPEFGTERGRRKKVMLNMLVKNL